MLCGPTEAQRSPTLRPCHSSHLTCHPPYLACHPSPQTPQPPMSARPTLLGFPQINDNPPIILFCYLALPCHDLSGICWHSTARPCVVICLGVIMSMTWGPGIRGQIFNFRDVWMEGDETCRACTWDNVLRIVTIVQLSEGRL